MYEQYYGLVEKPFNLTPDIDYYFQSVTHQEALTVLILAIQSGEGFIKVTGEVGTGKTLLCRKLLDQLGEDCFTVYIPNPPLNCNALLEAVATDMGISQKIKNENYLAGINDHLLSVARQNKPTVILLDEAQSLPEESLEAIRLLSNLETAKQKLVQIVLFGQPELDARLANSSIRQLQQRIVHSYQLRPLNDETMLKYIQHRLQAAGYFGPRLFSAAAISRLYQATQGVPRLINVLCHKALMLSYASGDFYVEKSHIKTAILDSTASIQTIKPDPKIRPIYVVGLFFALLIYVFILVKPL